MASVRNTVPLSRRRLLVAAAAGACAGLVRPPRARAGAGRTVRVGYQRYGTLIILKHRGLLETALARTGDGVAWSEFPAGPQMLQAMRSGALDFGITGDTPPVFAQAAQADAAPDGIAYVGHEPRAPFGEAIVVPQNSSVHAVAGLRNRSVALNKGSNVHWLLLRALQQAGLSLRDITPVYLVPSAARAAFDSGRIDAWAIWDPYLSSVQTDSAPRVLASAGDTVGNREFFLARRGFADASPDLVRVLLDCIGQADSWGEAHHDEVSRMLAADTGLPLPVVATAVGRLSFGVQPMDAAVVAEQQAIADAFAAQGLIPRRIAVQDAVWHAPG